jgi:hypothetical protein
MTSYHFSLIVKTPSVSHEEICDLADKLGSNECLDASIRGHHEGVEILFDREAVTMQDAITSALSDVENTGYQVYKIEMDRETIPA